METLDTLFVKGYVMIDPAHGNVDADAPCRHAGAGPAKTLTQIAYEQFHDMLVIRWGDRSKCLWSKTSKAECAEVISEISSVVSDVIDRLRADFHTQDLYMSFEALDLSTWDDLAATPVDADAPGWETKKAALFLKARRLFAALGVPFQKQQFKGLMRRAVALFRQLRQRDAGAATPRVSLDNRAVWALLMAKEADCSWAAPVIQLYACHPGRSPLIALSVHQSPCSREPLRDVINLYLKSFCRRPTITCAATPGDCQTVELPARKSS